MKYSILTVGILAALPMIHYKANAGDEGGAGGAAAANVADPAAPPPPPPVLTASEFADKHPIAEVGYIEVKKIVIDAGTQPRVAIDDDVVKEYADIIKTAIKGEQPNPFDSLPDDKLPQVFRDSTGRCVLADGFHRYGGHKGAHAKEMKVAFRAGDERDALRFSLGTNQEHGVRRTNRDKARAIKIALADPEWFTLPNTEIARVCGVSEFMVREARSVAKTPTVRTVTKGGKTYAMNTAGIGKGKGAGKKGAAKKKKQAAKKGAATAAAGKPGATTAEQNAAAETDKLLSKVIAAVGDTKGGEFRKAVLDGTLEISPRELRDLASFAPEKIKGVLPLVTGAQRMKPTKAFEFLASELPAKIVTELDNRAIGGGGLYQFETDTLVITATRKVK